MVFRQSTVPVLISMSGTISKYQTAESLITSEL